MSDYDEKPDWREIDRRKDKSRQYGRQDKEYKKDLPKDRWNVARRKEALDRLFMGEKGTVEHEKLYNKIHKSYGSGTFLSHVKRYVEKYGVPDDASTLLLVLDSKDQEIILQSFQKITDIFKNLTVRQKEDVKRKLSLIKLTDRSTAVREKAEDVLQELASS